MELKFKFSSDARVYEYAEGIKLAESIESNGMQIDFISALIPADTLKDFVNKEHTFFVSQQTVLMGKTVVTCRMRKNETTAKTVADFLK